jgi:hypothetical protein
MLTVMGTTPSVLNFQGCHVVELLLVALLLGNLKAIATWPTAHRPLFRLSQHGDTAPGEDVKRSTDSSIKVGMLRLADYSREQRQRMKSRVMLEVAEQ